MTIKTINLETLNAHELLDLVQFLTPADQLWLAEQLNRLTQSNQVKPLPQQATLDEAIQLYLADSCSLAKAADLAGITRWELQDILYERGTPVEIYGDLSAEEMDNLTDQLESQGYL
jgi:predicted HTH domain antitoxin